MSDGEADVNRALQILGDTCAECYVQLSLAASLRGEVADALLHADRAVTLAPDRADGYRQRGDARLQAGAGNPQPGIAATYSNRANTRYALEDMDGTCEDVALALRYGSDIPEIVSWATRLQV